ncbi:hypothetical protein DAERI_010137 [Deinococcus aerius]|uniref:Uncharacterized protein n=1 Tax=Deinococcus aerius TaxID=200253 RepID=A0A2I9DUF8_9DEIO|nr:hypothetical protein [Deinococcus aerius]GBF03965.1 hypothetical protein DAERI_010137 [Deinococcus aerius]
MALWLVVAFIVLSATLILALSLGPLRSVPNVGMLRALAAVQYVAAVLLAGARLTGNA